MVDFYIKVQGDEIGVDQESEFELITKDMIRTWYLSNVIYPTLLKQLKPYLEGPTYWMRRLVWIYLDLKLAQEYETDIEEYLEPLYIEYDEYIQLSISNNEYEEDGLLKHPFEYFDEQDVQTYVDNLDLKDEMFSPIKFLHWLQFTIKMDVNLYANSVIKIPLDSGNVEIMLAYEKGLLQKVAFGE